MLVIGNMVMDTPIVQGGMGVGVSRSRLAGAVAACGGMGVISTAQIGYDEPEFEKNPAEANVIAIKRHVSEAKRMAGGRGIVAVNVMTALKHYREHVRAAADAGVDAVICGAGLPLDLPELTNGKCLIAPIVSSKRAAGLILNRWASKYDTTADFIVVEGPGAGGHLGYKPDELANPGRIDFDNIVKEVIDLKKEYERRYNRTIPVIAGGGIYSHEDAQHIFSLGADAMQVASRFVATKECDASEEYKKAYCNARKEDIIIVKSPVGMPGRAINNTFIKRTLAGKVPVSRCYLCLERCNPNETPYCITEALTNAVRGDVENGLIFCGENTYKIDRISTVSEVIAELMGQKH